MKDSISTTPMLKQMCDFISNYPLKESFRMKMKPEIYKRLVEWIEKDFYPNLLAWKEGGRVMVAKVR